MIRNKVKGQVIEPSVTTIQKWHIQQKNIPTPEFITLYITIARKQSF